MNVDITTYEVDCDMRPRHYGSHDHYREAHALRRNKSVDYNTGRALASGHSLAELCGYTVPFGNPITWDRTSATIWLPPDDDCVDIGFLDGAYAYDLTVIREEAMQLCHLKWGCFHHIGAVPTMSATRSSYRKAGPQLDLALFSWSPEYCDTDLVYGPDFGCHPLPCAATTTKSTRVKVVSWLVDSGSALDLIDASRVKRFQQHIREREALVLDTANGELIVDRDIPLHVGRLGENIAPLVLPATPDVLSLGGRVVLDGYGFSWPAYSLAPQLVHPVTGDVIQLRVDDYCPYLDDDGTTHVITESPQHVLAQSFTGSAAAPAPLNKARQAPLPGGGPLNRCHAVRLPKRTRKAALLPTLLNRPLLARSMDRCRGTGMPSQLCLPLAGSLLTPWPARGRWCSRTCPSTSSVICVLPPGGQDHRLTLLARYSLLKQRAAQPINYSTPMSTPTGTAFGRSSRGVILKLLPSMGWPKRTPTPPHCLP